MIAAFESRRGDFGWKVYSHDEPSDLLDCRPILERFGFQRVATTWPCPRRSARRHRTGSGAGGVS